jgi:Ca2+-binding EF-hand superfamily protein
MHQIPLEERFRFDKSLDIFFMAFCKQVLKEVTGGPIKRDVTSFVDFYGKETKGFISYPEFRELYMTHVSSTIEQSGTKAAEEGKIRALFGIFDYGSLGRVSSQDFAKIVLS